MKRFIWVVLCFCAFFSKAQILEVKPGREAMVKEGPFGNAPQMTVLPAGTRVPKLGSATRYYSLQLSDGRAGWSYKGNFNEIQDPGATPATTTTVTAESLLARDDVLKIIVIDVEVGDATLIICPEENGNRDVVLIDTGENDGDRIKEALIKNGFALTGKPITRFFATHYDFDHIGAVPQIAPLCEVIYDHGPNKQTSTYRTATQGLDRRTIALSYQETFSGGVNIECVAANRATDATPSVTPSSSDENANSIALQISFDRFDYFTAGDLTFEVENALIGVAKNCDVYHANHHGSRATSSGLSFLQAIDPEVTVASNGTKHGHPSADVATRLISQIGSRFYQTNINPDSRANQPDQKFVADDTYNSSTTTENNEGAKGNITIVVDPLSNRYYVIMPGLPLAEATFPIEP